MQSKALVFLDGGLLFNLLASGDPAAIFMEAPFRFAIPAGLYDQPMRVLTPGAETDTRNAKDVSGFSFVDIANLMANGMIDSYAIDGCLDLFVNLAVHLSDAQAKVTALTISHKGHLATDDLKLRRIVEELAIDCPLHSTLELIHEWYIASGRSEKAAREVVQSISMTAAFFPPADDPLAGWWQGFLE